jgi:hypothetical protein
VDLQPTQTVGDVGGDSKMLLLVKRYYLLFSVSVLDLNSSSTIGRRIRKPLASFAEGGYFTRIPSTNTTGTL